MNVIEKIRRQNQESESASRQAVPRKAPERDGAMGPANGQPTASQRQTNIHPTRPAARCPTCAGLGAVAERPAVYGWHFWRDPYGTWHCTECEPPAADAMVRDWVLVDRWAKNPADGNPVCENADENAGEKIPTPEFSVSVPDFIDVIFDVDGQVIFARPGITQRAAREARENLEWFARREQAKRERREREDAKSQKRETQKRKSETRGIDHGESESDSGEGCEDDHCCES